MDVGDGGRGEFHGKGKEKAKDSGAADHVLDPAQDDAVARTMEITGGRGTDVGFECSGVQPVFDALLHALRTGGMLQVNPLFSKQPTLDTGPLLFKEVRIQGGMGHAHDHPTAIRLVREGEIDLTPFITRRISVEDIVPEGLRRLTEYKDEEVKILVHL
ncbi:zinc-binding dehydrogenase [Streptomyces sp. NPDC060275]|uniref:zinc-binding dehydrogenase n=1 Tax=Streptomyces sp. NPDC060275 TaxID=3347090 RepID=UPI003652D02E